MVINEKAKVVERYEYRYNDQDQRDREVVSGGLAELPVGEGTRVSEYNTVNQLLATSSPEETFVYDDDGNMAEGYTPEGYRFTASYDQADRLVQLSFTDSDGKVHLSRYGYRYDSFLARIEKLVDGTVVADIRIIRDGKLAIQERDGENRVSREYLWGLNLGGGIGGLLQVRQEGGVYACLYDGKGNVSALLDEAGETVAQYGYDAFGKVLATSGSVEQPFQFSTKRYDAETGLNYYGYRFYSPAIERWMNRDPLGEDGGINLYGFVENDPVNWLDPWGLEKICTSPWSNGTRWLGTGKSETKYEIIKVWEIARVIIGIRFSQKKMDAASELWGKYTSNLYMAWEFYEMERFEVCTKVCYLIECGEVIHGPFFENSYEATGQKKWEKHRRKGFVSENEVPKVYRPDI